MSRPEPRLQRKLLVLLLVPLLLLLALDAAAAWWTSVRLANLAYDRSLHEIAREIVLHVRSDDRNDGAGRLRLELSQGAADVLLRDPQDKLSFRLTAEDGALLGGDPGIVPSLLPPGAPPRYFGDRLAGEPVRFLEAWMPASEQAPTPRVLVQVAETLNKRNALAWEMVLSIVAPQLLLILIATLIVWLGVSRGLAPLARLRRAVSDRSHLDLSPIDTANVPGEVRPLVDEVNHLMARLGRTFDFQNRFVADAAHQLKTPVSGLKAQIELALREAEPERLRQSVAQLYVSADRLSRLVRQLLSLARNEPGALDAVQLQPLDLDAFALQVGMDWAPQAIRRGIDLGFEGVRRPLIIAAEPDRLRELINNLIDNAIRYSERDGRVTVRVGEAGPEHVQLAISDDGPAIPVPERTRVFERFHRLLGTPEDGSGLGLAIASEIATLHKARITLEEDSDGIGNTFSVIFPRIQSAIV